MGSSSSGLLEPLFPYAPFLALLVRVWLGATLMIHGRPKLKKQNRDQSIKNMAAKGVPAVGVWISTILEFFGGLFLVVGFIVPIVALFEAIYYLGIINMKRRADHAQYVAFGKPNFELEAFYVMVSVVIIVLGAGAFSLDGLLGL